MADIIPFEKRGVKSSVNAVHSAHKAHHLTRLDLLSIVDIRDRVVELLNKAGDKTPTYAYLKMVKEAIRDVPGMI
jgi:hypothetical protein